MSKLMHNPRVSWTRISLIAAVALFFALPMILPDRKHPVSEYACRTACEANLGRIAWALKMYSEDHGVLPESFLEIRDYLSPGRTYVCYHYFAYNIKEVVSLEKTDREKLLYTSYDYLGPEGDNDHFLGEKIIVREKIQHSPYAPKSWPAGHYVITRDFKVRFVPAGTGG